MPVDLFLALLAFAVVSSVTPGPNNLMLLASGANFGFRRTIPHMLGIGIGFTVLVLTTGAGLAQMFDQIPAATVVLKIAATLYLLYLAWRIAGAEAPGAPKGHARPMTFLEAAAFQWVNPKAWAMALSAISVYSPDTSLRSAVLVALVFGMVNLPSVSVWTVLGQQLARWLTSVQRRRVFNWTMAALLVLSLYPVLSI